MTTLTVVTVTKDSPGAGQFTIVGTYADATHSQPAQRVTVGEFPSGNRSWSRAHRVTDAVIQCLRSSVAVAMYLTSWSKIAMAFENSLTYIPKINTQPSAAAAVAGGADGVFTVDASSELAATYQWQYSANGTSGWTNASGTVNGCVYTNDTTASLNCNPSTTGQTGYFHRCVITNAIGSTTSSSAVLTIT